MGLSWDGEPGIDETGAGEEDPDSLGEPGVLDSGTGTELEVVFGGATHLVQTVTVSVTKTVEMVVVTPTAVEPPSI